jgi:hypothetical protein
MVSPQKYISRTRILALMSGILLCFQSFLPLAALADGTNLDLSSTERTQTTSNLTAPVTIDVGGTSQTINPGDLITSAEMVALGQILAGGQQSLQLNAMGAAIGGTFTLNSMSISNLTIPTGVTAIQDFGLNSTLNLTGNLTNSGNLYAVSSNSSISTATIAANNIFNQQGGLLTSVLPQGGLAGYSNLLTSLNLNLLAINDIVNAGTISSSGALSAIAGGSIINALPQNVMGALPVMSAVNNLNMQAMNIVNSGTLAAQLGSVNMAVANLNNAGLIQSMMGNISTLNSLTPQNGLYVSQTNSAVMEALNGSISFNVTDNLLKANMDVIGGNLLAQELNFNNGDGTLNVNLKDAAGAINVNTGIANFAVTQGTHGMNINSFNITGDPNLIYSGTGAYSSAAFNSLGGYVDIDNSSDTVNGSITFTGTINTTPSATGNGGYVKLNAGTFINTQAITTSANTTGTAGKINLIATGNITTGNITASSLGAGSYPNHIQINAGTSGTGNVQLGSVTGDSLLTNNSIFFSIETPGTITAGQVTYRGEILWNAGGNIQVTGINTSSPSTGSSSTILIHSVTGGLTVTTNGIVATSTGAGNTGSGAMISIPNGTVSITGGIDFRGLTGASGGALLLLGGVITMAASSDINLSATGTTGNAGNSVLWADGNITLQNFLATSGSTAGLAASHDIHAGNSGTGNISIGNITATSFTTGSYFVIQAPGTLAIGVVNIQQTGSGCCPTFVALAGTSGTPLAPAQSGNMTITSIDARGVTNGGNVYLVNMGTNGNLTVGNISTNVTGTGFGNAIIAIAHGNISLGNLNASSAGAGNGGGEIFISSGRSAAGVGITTGTITSTSGGGANSNLYIAYKAGVTASTGTISGIPGGNRFNGTPTGASANITGNYTITMGNGTLTGFNPGGFDSINAAASTITYTSTGSRATWLPLVTRGGDISIGAITYTAATVPVNFAAGNITVNGAISNAGDLRIYSSAGGFTAQNVAATRTSPSAVLDIHVSQDIVLPNGSNWSATGAAGGSLWITSAGGAINLGSAGNSTNNSVSIAGTLPIALSLQSKSGITSYGVTVNASTTSGTAGQIYLQSLDGPINLYSRYDTVTHNNANILANSSAGAGGLISMFSLSGGINFLRDTSLCCTGTTNAQINASGTTTSGFIGLVPGLSGFNMPEAVSFLSTGTGGAISFHSGTNSTFNGILTAPTIVYWNSNQEAVTTFNGAITGSSGIYLHIPNGFAIVNSILTSSAGVVNVTAGNLTVGASGSFSGQTVVLLADSVTNNGLISANTTGSTLSITAAYADLTIGGTGTYRINTTGVNTLTLTSTGVLRFSGTPIINVGTSNTAVINLNAQCSTCSIAFGASAIPSLQIANGDVFLSTPSVSFAAGSGLTTNQVAANTLTFNSGGGATPLTITGPGASNTATITTANGNIAITPTAGQTLTFTGAGTIAFAPGTGTFTTTTSVGTTIDTNTIVSSSSATITLNVNASTLTNNGTLLGTAAAGTLQVLSTGALTLAGNGVYDSGTGASIIRIQASNGAANALTISGSNTFDASSATGTVIFNSQNVGGSFVLGNSTTQTISNGSAVTISSRLINLGTTATINATGNSAISVNSGGGAVGLTVQTTTGSSGTISTAGSLTLTPTAGQTLIFSQSGAGSATLFVGGSFSTTTTVGTTVNAGVTLSGNSHMTFNVNGSTFTNNATVASTGVSSTLQIVSSGNLTIAGTGIYTSGSAFSTLRFQAGTAAGNTLTINTSNTLNSSANGTVEFRATNTTGQLTLANGTTQTINSAQNVNISTRLVAFGTTAAITSSAASAINFTSGGGAVGLTLRGTTGSNATVATTGGTINLTPTSGQTLNYTQTGAGATTINLNGGLVSSTTNTVQTIIATGVTVSSNNSFNITVNGAGFNNSGTLITTQSAGSITLQGTSGFALTALGTITFNAAGTANTLTIQLNGAGTLSLATTTFNVNSATGTVNLNAQAGTLNIGTSTITVSGGANINVSTPALTFGTAGAITGSGASDISINSGGGASALTITGTTGSTVNITTAAGGTIDIAPTSGQALTFAQTGAGVLTVNLNGGPVTTTTTSAGTNINTGITLSSNNSITMNVNGSTLTNAGIITTTQNGGTLQVLSTGALTIAGAGTYNAATGASTIRLQAGSGGANALNITTSNTFNAGSASGSVIWNSQNTGGSIVLTGSTTQTISNSASLTLSSPLVSFGALAIITAGGASAIAFNSGGGAAGLNIRTVTASSATITTTGGTFNLTPTSGQTLTFSQTGAGTATLNLNGGSLTTATSSAQTIINTGVVVVSNNSINMTVNGANFTNNGTLRTSQNGASVIIQGTNGFGLAGSGGSALSFTGTGANTLTIQLNGAGTLSLGTQTFNVNSATGTVNIQAQNASGIINQAASTTLTIQGGAALVVSAPSLTLGNTAVITASGASAISLNSGGGAIGLTITAPTGSNATISTTGGTIGITPTAGQTLSFVQSGAGISTLNLNGGAVTTTTSAGTSIASGVTVSSNNSAIFNVNGSTFTNNGFVVAGTNLTITSTSSLVLAGAGNYTNTTTMLVSATTTLNVNGNNSFTVNGSGGSNSITLRATNTGGTMTLANGTTQTLNNTIGTAGSFWLDADNIVFGTGTTITSTGAGDIRFDSANSANTLAITIPDSSSTTINSNGDIMFTGASYTLSKSAGTGSTTLTLNNGTSYNSFISATASGTSAVTIGSNVTASVNTALYIGLAGGTFTSNGTLTTTNSGSVARIEITSSGALALSGTPAGFLMPNTSNGTLMFQQAIGNTLTINSNYSNLNAGSAGGISIGNPNGAGGTITIAPGITFSTATSYITFVSADNLNMGAGSAISAAGNLTISAYEGIASSSITITGPSGSNATFSGASISVIAWNASDNGSITFAKSAVANTTLNFNTNSTEIGYSSITKTITINSGVTVAGSQNIIVNVNSATSGNFINNGLLTTSGSGATIRIETNGPLTMGGLGGAGITFTGTGSNLLWIRQYGATALSLGNQTFNVNSATGTVRISGEIAAASITQAAGTAITVQGGAALEIQTTSLTMGNLASFTATGASTITLSSTSAGGGGAITITAPTGSNATISTNGGSINIAPTAGQTLTFAQSGAGVSTLNLNGGLVTTTASNTTTIATGVTVTSNNDITMNVNNSTFTNNGTITSTRTGTPGQVTIQSSGTLSISAFGTITALTSGGGNGGDVNILTASTLSIPAGTISASATGAGNFNGGTIVISTTALTVTGGGVLALTADALGTGNGGSISITSSGATGSITLGSGAGNIQAFARGGTVASASGNGGNVSISAGQALTLNSGNFIDVSPRGNNGNGGNISLSAGSGAAGNITLNASLNANGIGTGNGGTITVTQNASGNNITLTGSVINAYKGASGTTNGAINLSITGTGAGILSLNNTSTIQGDGITLGATTVTINGTVTSTTANGTITIQSNGALTLNGTPAANIAVTGGGANAIVTVQASGANPLNLNTNHTFDAGAAGTVILQSAASGGSVVVAAATTITVPNSWAFQVISPTLTLNNTSLLRATGSGQYIELASGSLSMTINLPGGASQSATVQSTNGYILIGPYTSGLNLSFNAAAASTLNLNAQSVQTWAINGTTSVATNATLTSTGSITMNADGGSINVQGTVQSTLNGGTINFQGWGSNLTMGGTPGTIRFTGGAIGTINILTAGLGNTVNLNSSYNFDPGANGQVVITSTNISVAASTTITATNTSSLVLNTNNITLGNSAVLTTNKTTGQALNINVLNGSSALTITGTTGGSGIISTSGVDILINSNALTFAQTGAGTTTININPGSAGTVYTNTNIGNTTINSGVTVSTNGNLDMQVWGGGTLSNNGTLTSTKAAGSMLITGNANFTMSGAGTYSVAGAGANTLNIIAYGANFSITGNTTVNAGASGTVSIISANQGITLGNNVTVQSTNGSLLNVQASSLTLGNNAIISTTKASGAGLNIYSGSNQPLTITAPSGSSAYFLTDGGSINISSDGAMTFAKSGGSNATLNIGDANSGVTNINSWNTTTINGGVNVLSEKTMTFNVQRATIAANGQLNTTNGSISLTAQTGTLSIGANAIIYANEGNLVIQNVDTAGGSIAFGSAANIDAFTISNPALGNVTVFIGNSAGAPVVGSTPANVTVNQSGGGVVYFGTNGITASGPTNTLTAKGRNVQFSTGSGPATLISLGGSVTIDADPPDAIDIPAVSNTTSFANFANFNMPSISNNNGAITARDLNLATTNSIPLNQTEALMSDAFNYSALGNIDTDEVLMTVPGFTNSPFTDTKPSQAETNTNKQEDASENETSLLPISFASQAASSTLDSIMPKSQRNNQPINIQDAHLDLHTIEIEGAVIKCNGTSKVALRKDGSLVLKEGEILINADENTILHCNNIQIAIKPGSMILVNRLSAVTKLYNLCEDKSGSVEVTVEGRHIELSAGQEVAIGSSQDAITATLNKDNLGRRNLKNAQISSNNSFTRSEISLLSLMRKEGSVLPILMKSTTGKDYAVRTKLVKMAACLMTVTAGHGAYTAKP